jgi:hypothetical protein
MDELAECSVAYAVALAKEQAAAQSVDEWQADVTRAQRGLRSAQEAHTLAQAATVACKTALVDHVKQLPGGG